MQCVTFYCIWHFLLVNPDDPWLCSGCISDNVCSSVCHVLDWWTYTLVYPQHLSGFMDVINWWGAVSVWRKGLIIFYVLNDLCLLIFFCPDLALKRSLLETLIQSRDLEFGGDCVHWFGHVGLIGVLLGLSLHVHSIVISRGGSIGVGDITERCGITTGPILS